MTSHMPFFSIFTDLPILCKTFNALPFFFNCFLEKLYNPNVKIKLNDKTIYNCKSIDAPALYAINHAAIIVKFKESMLIVVPVCENPKSMNM